MENNNFNILDLIEDKERNVYDLTKHPKFIVSQIKRSGLEGITFQELVTSMRVGKNIIPFDVMNILMAEKINGWAEFSNSLRIEIIEELFKEIKAAPIV